MARERSIRSRIKVSSGGPKGSRKPSDQMRDIVNNFQTIIGELSGQAPDSVLQTVMRDSLIPVYQQSQVYVPYKTGDLKASGYIEVEKKGSTVFAEVGYGKGGIPHYTIIVHEDLGAYHRDPTSAKFLQRAIDEKGDQVRTRLLNGLRRALK